MVTIKLKRGHWYTVLTSESCTVTFPAHDGFKEKYMVFDEESNINYDNMFQALTDECTLSSDKAEVIASK